MQTWTLVFFVVAAFAKHEKYIGWKTYSITPSTQEKLEAFSRLQYDYELDVLSNPNVQREGIILVNPQNQDAFTKFLDEQDISYKVHRNDVKAALDYDDVMIEEARRENLARNGRDMPYDNYQRYEVIVAYMENIARRYPNTVTLVNAANSFEGRPIKYLKISTTNFQDSRKPVIVVDSGIHGMEWIAPPTVTYMIRKLTEDVTDHDLLSNFDWVLLPVANPDGYEFSFTNDRWWRKTRSTDQHASGILCPGVDGNRNYDYYWNTVGSSANPCANTYPGSRPFSEIETRVVRDILHEHLNRIALYLSMHSFGSMILYPWGNGGSLPPNAFALHMVGVAMADAIYEHQLPHFPRYQVGSAVLIVGSAASGVSKDYAHSIGVPLTFAYELPGLGFGQEGYNLPPRYIEQVAKETWEGVAVGVKRAGEFFAPPN